MNQYCHYGSHLDGSESVRLGVAVALIDESDRLLLELRSDVLLWGLTGGRLDPGETPLECGCREVLEETGIQLQPRQLNFFGIYADPKDGRILQYPDNRIHLLDIIFTAKVSSEFHLTLSSESKDLKFFSAEYLPSTIVPPAVRPISDLVSTGCLQ